MQQREDILEELEVEANGNKYWARFLALQLILFVAIFLFHRLIDILPRYIDDKGKYIDNFYVISMLIIFLSNALIAPKILSRIKPTISRFFALTSMIVSMWFTIVLLILSRNIVHKADAFNLTEDDLVYSAVFSFFFMMLSNIRFSFIRSRSFWLPLVLFIVSVLLVLLVLGVTFT